MAFRFEEIKSYKTVVICDDCKKETLICYDDLPLNFNDRMNGALSKNYTFKNYGDGTFKNYCEDCKSKYE
ncbi:hypothetical protein [Metabacillus fastidiosus]|uniref:hypothetical protein n=1 Tax=Metabacillus fastidiosus TaxID=1458 RepID=UPI003D26F44C